FERDSNDRSLSPLQVQRFFEQVFKRSEVKRKFGDIDVTIVPDKDSLTRILKMPVLRHLTIDVKKPNPDNLNSLTANVMGRLDKLKARRQTVTYTAEQGESLELTQDIVNEAQVAARNGKVIGVGRDNYNRKIEESTALHPWEQVHYFSENQQTSLQALMSVAEDNQTDGTP